MVHSNYANANATKRGEVLASVCKDACAHRGTGAKVLYFTGRRMHELKKKSLCPNKTDQEGVTIPLAAWQASQPRRHSLKPRRASNFLNPCTRCMCSTLLTSQLHRLPTRTSSAQSRIPIVAGWQAFPSCPGGKFFRRFQLLYDRQPAVKVLYISVSLIPEHKLPEGRPSAHLPNSTRYMAVH